MIVSHKHKFIFIKTRKTAGTSIEIALRGICGEDDIITPLIEEDEKKAVELGVRGAQNYDIPYSRYRNMDWLSLSKRVIKKKSWKRLTFYNHMPAADVKRFVGDEIWNSYYKFCFERHPFDKFISLYYWIQWWEDEQYSSLTEFINSKYLSMKMGFDLYSINKKLAVDKVYKFEEMEDSLKEISEKLNLDIPLRLYDYRAKGNVRRDKHSSIELLNEEDQNTLKVAFAREIELLGY